jgi:hypothetical protein
MNIFPRHILRGYKYPLYILNSYEEGEYIGLLLDTSYDDANSYAIDIAYPRMAITKNGSAPSYISVSAGTNLKGPKPFEAAKSLPSFQRNLLQLLSRLYLAISR